MQQINEIVGQPPFNVTRASHVVLNVRDLEASKHFYRELVGLIVSDEDASTVWLRGLEERGHHSLVLRKSAQPGCARIGMRVHSEDDVKRARDYFAAQERTPNWWRSLAGSDAARQRQHRRAAGVLRDHGTARKNV
jgi:catechol 2,3-dioxygenase